MRRSILLLFVTIIYVLGTGCSGCEDPVVSDNDNGGEIDAGEDGGDVDLDAAGGDGDTAGGEDVVDSEDSGDVGDAGDGGDGDVGSGDGGDSDTGGTDVGDGDVGDGDVSDDADSVDAPSGLSEPCQNGSGWTLFHFHYDQYSTSARIDVWDASCEYSLAPGSACNVRTVTQGFGDVDTTPNGYPIVTTSDYIRVRFSVAGLDFSEATVHVEGHGFYSVAFTEYRVWSPLYGDRVGGPIDNSLQWSSLDWTGMLYPTDDPGLTAIQIYANLSTHDMAVRSVELCVE